MDLAADKIVIVGCGPGSPEYLTDAARRAVAGAEVLAGSPRLLEMFSEHRGERLVASSDIAGLLETLAARLASGRRMAVLVSGDPGVYSLATAIVKRFGRRQCRLVPGVSSVQLAFARLGLDWARAEILSLHATTPGFSLGALRDRDRIALLAGRPDAIHWAAEAASGLKASHAAVLCENLTLPDERVQTVSADQLRVMDASSLSIVLLIRRSLLS